MAISVRFVLGGVSMVVACDRQAEDDEPTTAEVCAAIGDLYGECYPEYVEYVDLVADGCEEDIEDNYSGSDCGAAYFDYFVCLSAVDCAVYTSGTACPGELNALESICN